MTSLSWVKTLSRKGLVFNSFIRWSYVVDPWSMVILIIVTRMRLTGMCDVTSWAVAAAKAVWPGRAARQVSRGSPPTHLPASSGMGHNVNIILPTYLFGPKWLYRWEDDSSFYCFAHSLREKRMVSKYCLYLNKYYCLSLCF